MATIITHERTKREAQLQAMTATGFLNVPFIARFGKELGLKLIDKGYKAPEELLFLDTKLLMLSREEGAIVRKYQRRYLPKGFRQLEINATAFEEIKQQLPQLLLKVATEGL